MRVLTFVVGLAFTDEGTLDRAAVEADLLNAVRFEFTHGYYRHHDKAVMSDVVVTPSSALAKLP